jgi:hypothetical protein
VQIQINDLICGSCRLTAKRVKSDHVQLSSSTSSVPGIHPTLPSIASASTGPYIPGTDTTMTTIITDTATQTKSKYFDDNLGEIDSITLKIPRSMINNKNCLICNNKSKSLINVPKDAYLDTYINYNILIPNESKCCKKHLTRKNTFSAKCINDIEIVSNYSTLNSNETRILLDSLRNAPQNKLFNNFQTINKINDKDCKRLTGLNVNNFNTLLNTMTSLKQSPNRNKSQALATYLFWLRTGLDYRTIASILSFENHQRVGEYCTQVRQCLLKDFVPNNIGVSHLTREQWEHQKTVFSKELLNINDSQVALLADGTYLCNEKSSNNELQRESWSVQKNRHLSKPMVVCTPNGKIVDISC